MSLPLYELGQHCPTHPEAALAVTQVPYRYVCSECKKLQEKAEESVVPA